MDGNKSNGNFQFVYLFSNRMISCWFRKFFKFDFSTHHRFRECVLDQTRRTCNQDDDSFTQQLLDKAFGFFRNQCIDYVWVYLIRKLRFRMKSIKKLEMWSLHVVENGSDSNETTWHAIEGLFTTVINYYYYYRLQA